MNLSGDITGLIRAWRAGDPDAQEQLFGGIYHVLHAMAASRLRSRNGDLTLEPTSLVHEAFIRLLGADVEYVDRAHFFALAALKMRSVLVDHARAQMAGKRGGGVLHLTLSHADIGEAGNDGEFDLLSLHQALDNLTVCDPRVGKAIEMVYFGGMSNAEVALVLGVSVPTVERDLRFGRAWLNRALA